MPGQGQPNGDTAGRTVLRTLIENTLVEQLAQKENVAPTDQELDAFFNGEKAITDFSTVDGFDKLLEQIGATSDDVKQEQLKPTLSRLKLLAKGTTVSDSDIQQYYEKNKSRFSQPERAHIRKIAVASQTEAQAIGAQIKAGKSFDSFLGQSLDTSSPTGDVPRWVPLTGDSNPQLKPLIDAVKSTPEGQVTPPLNYGGSWWIVQVVKKEPASTLPLDQIKGLLQFQVLGEKAQSNFSNQMDLQQKMRQFQTTADIKTDLPQYKTLIDQIKNPPPTPAMPQFAPPPSATAPAGKAPVPGGKKAKP
jgi:foldase protein PrsA